MNSGKKAQHDFPEMRGGGVKGRLELFQKFIRFGWAILPLVEVLVKQLCCQRQINSSAPRLATSPCVPYNSTFTQNKLHFDQNHLQYKHTPRCLIINNVIIIFIIGIVKIILFNLFLTKTWLTAEIGLKFPELPLQQKGHLSYHSYCGRVKTLTSECTICLDCSIMKHFHRLCLHDSSVKLL